jgi:SnoaL-like protein
MQATAGRPTAGSTKDVLDHHLKCFGEGNLEGILADYSSDAVLFMPTGPLKGPEAMKPVFQNIFSEFAKPGASFVMQQQCIEGDYAYIIWNAETADNYYEVASDTFVVRDGKIVAQSFAAKIILKVDRDKTTSLGRMNARR